MASHTCNLVRRHEWAIDVVSCVRFAKSAAMQLLVSLVTIWLTGSLVQGRENAEWQRFQEDTHRVSFAYPPELHPVTAPAEHLRGIEGWVNRVSLLGDGFVDKLPVLTVDVFICDDPALNPRVPCQNEASYRRMCDRFEKLTIGDSVGFQCVTYGRAACAWSIRLLREKLACRSPRRRQRPQPTCRQQIVPRALMELSRYEHSRP